MIETATESRGVARLFVALPNPAESPALRHAYRDAVLEPGGPGLRLTDALGLDRRRERYENRFVRLPSLPRFARDRAGAPDLPPWTEAEDAVLARLPFLAAAALVPLEEVEDFADWLGADTGFVGREPMGAAPALPSRPIVAPDLPIRPMWEHWSPRGHAPRAFHTRRAALALLRAPALRDHAPAPLDGEGVNVAVFDTGLNAAALASFVPGATVAGRWEPLGGDIENLIFHRGGASTAAPIGHGDMVARNVLGLAPRARLFDLPLLPPRRIANVQTFTSDAAGAMAWVGAQIAFDQAFRAEFPGPWVFCNAWGVFDTRLEVPTAADPYRYTSSPLNPLNLVFVLLDLFGGHDIVFGAGNAGQFAPDFRAGPDDIGPGRSVLGAASSHATLSVGAVRSDGLWLGYSSQGPGQPGFKFPWEAFTEKPDLCCPSSFVEVDDAHAVSGGTSTACGLAAGAIAALRTRGAGGAPALPALGDLAPWQLRAHLRATARKPPTWKTGAGYDIRFGHGILDLEAALAEARPSA